MKFASRTILPRLTSLVTPDSGFMTLGFKSDGILYKRDSSGIETSVEAAAPAMPSGGIEFASMAFSGTGWQRITSSTSTDTFHPLTNGMSVNTGSLVVPQAGFYAVYAAVVFNSGSAGTTARRGVAVQIGNSASPLGDGTSIQLDLLVPTNAAQRISVSGYLKLDANDRLSVYRETPVSNHYSSTTATLRAVRIA